MENEFFSTKILHFGLESPLKKRAYKMGEFMDFSLVGVWWSRAKCLNLLLYGNIEIFLFGTGRAFAFVGDGQVNRY
ncbi:MAG: hypothetical protein HDR99_05900 [Bacteroides sp.]|nr:hypothetical protein [Bacteroides sp.]